MTLSKTMLYHYAECLYAECHVLIILMMHAFLLNVVMLNIVAPCKYLWCQTEAKGFVLIRNGTECYQNEIKFQSLKYDLILAFKHHLRF